MKGVDWRDVAHLHSGRCGNALTPNTHQINNPGRALSLLSLSFYDTWRLSGSQAGEATTWQVASSSQLPLGVWKEISLSPLSCIRMCVRRGTLSSREV